jgi:hypothetical protein
MQAYKEAANEGVDCAALFVKAMKVATSEVWEVN